MDLLGGEQELLHLLQFLSRKLKSSIMSSIMSCASKEGACWTLSISSLLSCWMVFLDPHTHGFSGYSSLLSHDNFSYTPLAVRKKRAATSGSHKQPNAPACSSTTRRTEIRRESMLLTCHKSKCSSWLLLWIPS